MDVELNGRLNDLKKILHPEYVQLLETKTDCNVHGNQVEALINGKCAPCFKEKMQTERDKVVQENFVKAKKNALIPLRFLEASLENYRPQNEKSNTLLRFCSEYDFESNLLMLGNTGTGKTHLGCALLSKALKKNLDGLYIKFYQLTEIKIRKPQLFENIIRCDILVIDEYGQQESDFKSNLLFEIIDQRYDDKVKTILISNFSPEKFTSSLSAPLYSRIKEDVIVKTCDWNDYRLKKGQTNGN